MLRNTLGTATLTQKEKKTQVPWAQLIGYMILFNFCIPMFFANFWPRLIAGV